MTETIIDTKARRSRGWRVAGWGTAAALLALPAIAMQFSDDVNWGPGDFLVIGLLLVLAGLAIEMGVRLVRTNGGRAILVATVLSALLLIWAELAVGIFH